MNFGVIGGQGEVMAWSVSYWNLKIHIDIGKTYPTLKNQLPSSIQCVNLKFEDV